MNCEAVQKQLLGSERPGRPSAEASAHLAACGGCREWHQRLVQLEAAVPRLPVPSASAARLALVRHILAGKDTARRPRGARRAGPAPDGRAGRPSIAMVVGSWIMDPHSSPRRRVAAGLVAGVAAALLLFITGWLIWDATHTGPQVPPLNLAKAADPLDRALDKYKIKPKGDTPIEAMADAAEQLHGLAAARPADGDLIAIAQLYGDVVNQRVVKLAEKLSDEGLSVEERSKVLQPIAKRLAKGDSQWQGLATQTGLADGVKDALLRAALAARNGSKRLEELCKA
jgi:hypothetical protein